MRLLKKNELKYDRELSDLKYHALLAKIQGDPQTYKEAINSSEKEQWIDAIRVELDVIRDKQVYTVVERAKIPMGSKRANIIDSRWVFKKKTDETGSIKYKGRLVIRGFKDKHNYDLRETYAPVSRISLIRAFFSIANKYNYAIKQLDVETAFLYGELSEDIYLEIPEGVQVNNDTRKQFVCKLNKSLYGLKISPKKME